MTRYRVIVIEKVPDFIFYAKSQLMAELYTEMCGFTVKSCFPDYN